MKNLIYLFVLLVITGLSFSSCEQQAIDVITESSPEDLQLIDQTPSTSMTVVYEGQEYIVELNEEGTVEAADLEPALAEIWDRGHFIMAEEADKVYLYDTLEKADKFIEELYPDSDLSNDNENIESRGQSYLVLYRKNFFTGQSSGEIFNPVRNLGASPYHVNNGASSMIVNNGTNRPVKVTLYNWKNWGSSGGTYQRIVPSKFRVSIAALSSFNNRASSVWITEI